MPNLLEKLLKPQRKAYRPPPIPRPLFIVSFHEFIKWFRQLEPGLGTVENDVLTMYTCLKGRIALIDEFNLHMDNTIPVAQAHAWFVIRNQTGAGLRYYSITASKNENSHGQFTIPTPGDYLSEGDYVELYSPAANVVVEGSFHGWEGARVQ